MIRHHLAILGPTASGKSALAAKLASMISAEIINCDSLQFYRRFDIGTAKPSPTDLARTPHHLIDCKNWDEDYDAGQYALDAKRKIHDIESRARRAIVCGGSGLYFRALASDSFHADLPADEKLRARLSTWTKERLWKMLQRLDPARSMQIHPNDIYRIGRALELRILLKHSVLDLQKPAESSQFFVVVVSPERQLLKARIATRLDHMLASGWIQEVENLIKDGVSPSCKAMQSIGYKQITQHLNGEFSAEECREKIFFATCQYAKRQMTWFNKVDAHVRIDDVNDVDRIAAGIYTQCSLS